MKKTNANPKTIKEIIDTIPARLGLTKEQVDLSTPEKAYEFLTDSNYQIFAKVGGLSHIFDGDACNCVVIHSGYKAMYDLNALFSWVEENKACKLKAQKKYGYTDSIEYCAAVIDETGCVEDNGYTNDELQKWIIDKGWPFAIQIDSEDLFLKFNRFFQVLQKICLQTQDWIELKIFISYVNIM